LYSRSEAHNGQLLQRFRSTSDDAVATRRSSPLPMPGFGQLCNYFARYHTTMPRSPSPAGRRDKERVHERSRDQDHYDRKEGSSRYDRDDVRDRERRRDDKERSRGRERDERTDRGDIVKDEDEERRGSKRDRSRSRERSHRKDKKRKE
jgi:hypothetical protein